VLNAVSNRILRALGIDADAEFEEGGTPEDLKLLITRSQEGGQLGAGAATMLVGVFHLHEQQARHVMTPIPAVVAVDASADLDAASEVCEASGHTRLVVSEPGRRDHVKGILHAADIMRGLRREGGQAPIAPFVRSAPVVPETKALDALLTDLQREQSSMAIVTDEYGRVAGIVTVEDVLEEIVGEIADETDSRESDIRATGDGRWQVAGHVPVRDLADHGISLASEGEGFTSVGGLVFARLGRLPDTGDSVEIGDYVATVEDVRDNRVERVELRPVRAS
jgi:CBS domain containing-hemolysin-like protein